MKVVKAELLWFLRGEDNISWLQEQDVHIWADTDGYVGPLYGATGATPTTRSST